MIIDFTNKMNSRGNATIKFYEPKRRCMDVIAMAVVVTKNLSVWRYSLFSDGTVSMALMSDFEDGATTILKLEDMNGAY